MKIYQLAILLIFVHLQLFAQIKTIECEEMLGKMIDENMNVKLNLQDANTSLQKITELLTLEQILRIKSEKELVSVLLEVTRMKTYVHSYREQANSLELKITKQYAEIDKFRHEKDSLNAHCQKLTLQVDSLNQKVATCESIKDAMQLRFNTREKYVKQERSIEIAKSLLRTTLSNEEIAKHTGLTVEQIEALRSETKKN